MKVVRVNRLVRPAGDGLRVLPVEERGDSWRRPLSTSLLRSARSSWPPVVRTSSPVPAEPKVGTRPSATPTEVAPAVEAPRPLPELVTGGTLQHKPRTRRRVAQVDAVDYAGRSRPAIVGANVSNCKSWPHANKMVLRIEQCESVNLLEIIMNNVTSDKSNGYVLRDKVLKLLADAEVVQVSTVEASSELAIGDQFLNLDALEQGPRYSADAQRPTANVLAKKAVHEETWAKILNELAS